MSRLIKILIAAAVIGLFILYEANFAFNDHIYTITVTDKDRIVEKDVSYYLVYGDDEDGNVIVLRNSDSLSRGKFDSSDIQGLIKIGKTYDFVVVGQRIPFLSCYENIIDLYEVTY